MSDFNSSLPVKTLSNGDIAAKIVDGTITSQALAIDSSGRPTVKLDDGNGNIITSQANGAQRALDVGVNVGGTQVDPRSIRALTSSDVVTSNQGSAASLSSAWPVKHTDGTNTQAVKAASTAASATDPAAVVSLSPNSPMPAGTNALGSVLANMQVSSTAVSATNPVPVSVVSSVPGSAVQSAQTSAALAAGGTANLQYTITTAKTLSLSRVFVSGEGRLKVIVSIETGVATGVFTTKFVAFNSSAFPNIDISVVSPPSVAAGVRVQAAITNLEASASDVYATFEGTEN